ncbi:MAG: glycosyltransferase family 39 protein [Candidatus Zixiibacteriota bacterium]|jgi:4-amino-4-deoxy-L-arabinose transferase-like glycosyltransferase
MRGEGVTPVFEPAAFACNLAAAAFLCVIAAGWIDIWGILTALTPQNESPNEVLPVVGQIRLGAGVAAAFFAARAFGVFRLPWRRRLAGITARRSNTTWFLIIFGAALALRLGYAAVSPPPPISDESSYDALARSVLAGGGFSEDGVPTAYRPVGYVAVLAVSYAVFGIHFWPVIIVQCIVGAATAVLTWRLAALFFSENAARAAGLIVATLPSQWAYTARLFPVALMGFFVVAATYVNIKYGKTAAAAGAGFLAGVATLAAPVLSFLPGAFFIMDLLAGRGPKRALLRAAVAACVTAAVVAPWTYRNWRVLDAFVPVSTNGGVVLWMGNNPDANGSYVFPLSPANPLWSVADEVERDRLGRRLALEYIRDDPGAFLKLLVPKFAHLYGSDISAFQYGAAVRGIDVAVSARSVSARLAQAAYALLIAGFIVGMMKNRRRIFGAAGGRLRLAALLVMPACLTACYLVFHGFDRYHFPMLPFMAILAGAALCGDGDPAPARGDVEP